MKRFSDRHQLSTLSELNVTPLLDLAFVLLIIFMITTPLMENSSELILPTSTAAQGALDPALVETVDIDREMRVSLGGEPMSVDAVADALRRRVGEGRARGVVLRPHRELTMQQMEDVIAALKRAGVTKIGLASTGP